MPPDNGATVGIGAAVDFPQDGPDSGGAATRLSIDTFTLSAVGTYRVSFSVPVSEAGQLVISLDTGGGFVALPYSVSGRATGTTTITGDAIIITTNATSVVKVINPVTNSTALTITPMAGGASAIASTLIIQRIS